MKTRKNPRQRTIAICGSMFHYETMDRYRKELEASGYLAHCPTSFEEMGVIDYDKYTQEEGKELKTQHDLIRDYFRKIDQSSCILVVNYEKRGVEGYVGGNTLMEMGHAFGRGRDIFMIYPAPDLQYKAEIEAMSPIIIGENIKEIEKYYSKLPTIYVASKSKIKLDAVEFAFRRCHEAYNVIGEESKSGVAEQPMSFEATVLGAENRLNDLKSRVKHEAYEYLVSVEGGISKIDNKNYYGIHVCCLENAKGERSKGISVDLPLPSDAVELIPKKYPDLGVYVQKVFGVKEKDPYVVFSGGKVRRIDVVEDLVYKTLGRGLA